MLKIRLQRIGRKNDPSFRVVLTDSKNSTKSGKFLEVLGTYDPKTKNKNLVAERIMHWIKEGAKLDKEIAPKADLSRELRTRWQPPAPPAAYPFAVTITSLAFTPDNLKLVVGGHHELTVWD